MTIPQAGYKYITDFFISEEKISNFADFSGDHNPIHTSRHGAREYGLEKPVAHGVILLSELSRIIGMEVPGNGAFWNDINITFSGPVFWNETVTIRLEVVQSSEAASMVKLKFDVTNGGRRILSGTCRVVCLKRFNRRLPMPDISSRVVLVSGGSRGVGLEVVRVLMEEGYKTISLSRNQTDELAELKKGYGDQLSLLFVDLKEPELLEERVGELCGRVGGIHAIIHAASPVPVKRNFHGDIYKEIGEFMEVYVKSLIKIAAIAIPYMKKANYGRIVTLGTSFILGTPPQAMYPYIVAKEALWGLTKSFSVDYGRYGITANMVSPSMMATSLTSDIPNAVKQLEAETNPLKRLAEPFEVAKTVSFLCGEGATFINGTNIPVTGGKQ